MCTWRVSLRSCNEFGLSRVMIAYGMRASRSLASNVSATELAARLNHPFGVLQRHPDVVRVGRGEIVVTLPPQLQGLVERAAERRIERRLFDERPSEAPDDGPMPLAAGRDA